MILVSGPDDDKYDNEKEPPVRPAQLVGLVYDELRRLARGQMSRESLDHTLQPTAVVHEAYMRLARNESIEWQGRTHFLAISEVAQVENKSERTIKYDWQFARDFLARALG